MGEKWEPKALRAAGDIDRQATADVDLGTIISTRDGLQLVTEWRTAIARAERAEAALAACQHDLAEMIERKEVLRNCWEGAEQELWAMKEPAP